MKSKYFQIYYNSHKISMTTEQMADIRWLCGQGVSFYLVIDRGHNSLYKICTAPEDAEEQCIRLNREFPSDKGYNFIFDYIHNGQ